MDDDKKELDELISKTIALEAEAAKKAGTVGYMARALVQATLPHKATKEKVFTRQNGAFELSIMSPHGLPYGTIPRLLLSWMTTEAVRTQSPHLVLGSSLSAFMSELNLLRTGGKRGDITRLKKQTVLLFSSTVSCRYSDETTDQGRGFNIAKEYNLWWNPKKPDQLPLWQSTVTLGTDFFKEIVERPVPVDMEALMKLKRSPMALDIYFWLTYRLSYLHRDLIIPWPMLQMQFGADYAQTTEGQYNFKRKFLLRLKDVQAVYDKAKVFSEDRGLRLKPSPSHVPKKAIPYRFSKTAKVESPPPLITAQFDEESFPVIHLKTLTYEKAKEALQGSGLDVYALESDWREWITKSGNMPKSPDAAFIGFCRKKAKQK